MSAQKSSELPASSPVRRAYELFKEGVKPHNSFDHTSVLFAVRGAGELWDVRRLGHLHVNLDGSNDWRDSPDKDHAFLRFKTAPERLAKVIEELMLYQPPN